MKPYPHHPRHSFAHYPQRAKSFSIKINKVSEKGADNKTLQLLSALFIRSSPNERNFLKGKGARLRKK